MKQLVMSLFAIACLFTAGSALAAPPARASTDQPCTHCQHASEPSTHGVQHRGGQFGTQPPCNHGVAAQNVRWGNAQKPCEHCKHMG